MLGYEYWQRRFGGDPGVVEAHDPASIRGRA